MSIRRKTCQESWYFEISFPRSTSLSGKDVHWFIFSWKKMEGPHLTCMSIPMMTIHFALPVSLKVVEFLVWSQLTGLVVFDKLHSCLGILFLMRWPDLKVHLYFTLGGYLPRQEDLSLLKIEQSLSTQVSKVSQSVVCNGVSKTSENIARIANAVHCHS